MTVHICSPKIFVLHLCWPYYDIQNELHGITIHDTTFATFGMAVFEYLNQDNNWNLLIFFQKFKDMYHRGSLWHCTSNLHHLLKYVKWSIQPAYVQSIYVRTHNMLNSKFYILFNIADDLHSI